MLLVVALIVLLVLFAGALLTMAGVMRRRPHPTPVHEDDLDRVARRASRRLQLRSPEAADREFFVEMASDPVAAEANGWHHSEAAIVRARFDSPRLFRDVRAGEVVAIERSTGERVATIRFATSPHDPSDAVSVGIHVHTDHRGKGYGREVMAAGILLVQRTGRPVHVGTRTTNLGMQQIMHRLGYHPEPATRDYNAPNGHRYDSYWYRCGTDAGPPAGLFAD